jgi:hypothetical protein
MPGAWLINGNQELSEAEQSQSFDELIEVLKQKKMEWRKEYETR